MEDRSLMAQISNINRQNLYLMGNGGFLLSPIPAGKIFTREQLSEEQQEIGKTARTFLDTKLAPRLKDLEEKQCDADGTPLAVRLLKEIGQLGILGVDVPEEYGGLGMDLTTTMYVVEAIGAVGSFGTTCIAHMGIGTLPILFFGTLEQKAKYLPKQVNADWVSCYCLTEPESGSDALSGKTKAVLEGDYYIVNGAKQFITNGTWADVGIVFCRIQDKYSALIVELNSPGVVRGVEEKKMGLHGSSTCSLIFENAKVPKGNLLGNIGDAATIALNILNMGRMELGFATLGGTKKALAYTLDYVKQRKQFGRPIIEFDLQMAKLADMTAGVFAVDSMLYRIVAALDHKIAALPKGPDYWENFIKAIRSFAMEASIAKIQGSELLYAVTTDCVKMLGGYGYIAEYNVERWLRDSVIHMLYEGTNDINRLVIFDFLVRSIYGSTIPFGPFMDELETIIRKRQFVYPDDSQFLSEEKSRVYAGKCLLNFLLNEALMQFGKDIKNNQQLICNISDITIQLYTADSALARANYLSDAGRKEADLAKPIAQLVTSQAINQINTKAWQIFSELCNGKARPALKEKLAWLCSLNQGNENAFALRREIASAVLDKGFSVVGW